MSDRFLVFVGDGARRAADAVRRQLRVDGWSDVFACHLHGASFLLERSLGRTANTLRFHAPRWRSDAMGRGERVHADIDSHSARVGIVDPALQTDRSPWEVMVAVDGEVGLVSLTRSPAATRALFFARHPADGLELVAANSVTSVMHALPRGTFAVDHRAVASVLALGHVVEPLTMLEDVSALRGGESLSFAVRVPARPFVRAMFDRGTPVDAPRTHVVRTIRATLTEAVERTLDEVERPACFLSGGVDSSLLAAIGSQLLRRELHTFSLVVDGPEARAPAQADAVAQVLGTAHTVVPLTRNLFDAELDRALSAFDQPTVHGLHAWFLAKAANEHGFEMALSGAGSDELFGGHACYRSVPGALKFKRAVNVLPESAQRALARGLAGVLGGSDRRWPGPLGRMLSLLELDDDCAQLYFLDKHLLLPRALRELMHPGAHEAPRRLAALLSDEASQRLEATEPLAAQLSQLEQRFHLESHRLRDLAAVRSAWRLDVALPYRSAALVAAARMAAHSGHLDAERPKQILIDAFRDILPLTAIAQPRPALVLPLAGWLAGAVDDRLASGAGSDAPLLEQLGLDPSGWHRLLDDGSRRRGPRGRAREWVLYVLLDWGRRHARWLRAPGSPAPQRAPARVGSDEPVLAEG